MAGLSGCFNSRRKASTGDWVGSFASGFFVGERVPFGATPLAFVREVLFFAGTIIVLTGVSREPVPHEIQSEAKVQAGPTREALAASALFKLFNKSSAFRPSSGDTSCW